MIMNRVGKWILSGLVICQFGMECRAADTPADPLLEAWNHPPIQACTRAYWWWLNGNVDKAAITKDLEWMSKIGMGGGLIFHAGGGMSPWGPTFGSPEFRELFKHAVQEADRLGLELTLSPQSGWNLGGSMVTPEQSAKHITWSDVRIAGPCSYNQALPMPPSRDDFYRDARVIAYRLKPETLGKLLPPTVKASTSPWPKRPDATVDGSERTLWSSVNHWQGKDGLSPANPEWLEFVFVTPVTLTGLNIISPTQGWWQPRKGEVQIRGDNGELRALQVFESMKKGPVEIRFPATNARSFRILFQEAFDRYPTAEQVVVSEVAFLEADGKPLNFGKPLTPVDRLESKTMYEEGANPTIDDKLSYKPGDEDARPENIIDLTAKLGKDGVLHWDVPEGTWQIYRFGYTISGGKVSCSGSRKWKGYVVNYLDPKALTAYWREVVDPLLDDIKPHLGKSLKGFETDSWEGGGINWTERMPEEFKTRRGYDLVPFIPVFAGCIVQSRDASNRFLYDLRKTVGELMAENHYGVLAKLAAERGLIIHCEAGGPHAGPFDALQNWGRCDWPMGEFWVQGESRPTEDSRFFMKGPASAAHIYGKQIVCGEGFTSVGPHWNDTLWSSQKPTFDHEACAGLNLIFWHAFTSSPSSMGIPGQEYFAGTHFNPQITWANQAHAFVSYLNRCQSMLQQGRFVADVCYYYGDHVPNVPGRKHTDPAKVLPTYDFDYLNEEMLLKMQVKDGRLVVPCGMSYRLLVLPDLKVMSLPVLKKVHELVKAGAAVCGPRPEKNPSLAGAPAADQEFTQLCDQLWSSGKVANKPAKEVLASLGVLPDFEVRDMKGPDKMDYIHRRDGDAEIYFLSNQAGNPVAFTGVFRVSGKRPELWDAVTGQRRDMTEFECKDGPFGSAQGRRTSMPLELEAYGSCFVVFRFSTTSAGSHPPSPSSGATRARPSKREETDLGTWRAEPACPERAEGATPRNFPELKPVYELAGPWRVQFDPRWGGPTSAVTFATLTDWTSNSVKGIKYYSGTATYRKVFDVDVSPLTSHVSRLFLSLGEVHEMASVRLNGKDLGVIWCPPWQVEITDVGKATGNELEIDVVNNWPNRLIGDGKLPSEKLYTKTTASIWYKPGKDGKDHPLFPAGLLGPVRVMAAE
jgi:hypothetical protein